MKSQARGAVLMLPKSNRQESAKDEKPSTSATTDITDKLRKNGISAEKGTKILSVLVSLLRGGQLDSYGLEAALQLLARLTRDSTLAAVFVEKGGLDELLRLKTDQKVETRASLLAAQLIRNCMEDDETLAHTMEKVWNQF